MNNKVCKNKCDKNDKICKNRCDMDENNCRKGRLILSQTPSPMCFAATHNPDYIEKFGEQVATLYKALALTTNFAPLLDLKKTDSLSIIGTRSFGANEDNVEIMAHAYAKGMIRVGISPVFKHWPDLGTSYLSNYDNFNANTDLHELRKPLTIHSHIDTSTALYDKLLKKKIFSNYAAVMTAHVNVEQYKDKCRNQINTVSLCKSIIEKELRNKLSNKDTVIISDDFAYLKAIRERFDYDEEDSDNKKCKSISSTIKRCFDADHDIIIIGSLIPNKYYNKCDWKHDLITRSLNLLYNEDYTVEEKKKLQKSVQRIIAWKYNIYNKLYNLSSFEEFKKFELKKNDINLKQLKEEMTELSNEVLKNSILLIAPSNIAPKELSKKVNLHSYSEVFCIGPKYSENDLRAELEVKLIKKENINIDLEYNFSLNSLKNYFKYIGHNFNNLKKYEESLIKKTEENYKKIVNKYIEEFIKVKSEEIKDRLSKFEDKKLDCLIFGLINKPAHIKIFENVYNYYKNIKFYKNTKPKLIVVSFSTSSLFNEPIFQKISLDNVIFISTFSNSSQSNKFLVEALFDNKYIVKSVKNSPIKINKFLSEVAIIEPPKPTINIYFKKLKYFFNESIIFEVIVYLFEILISIIFIWKIFKENRLFSLISTGMGLILFVGINKLQLLTFLSSFWGGPIYVLESLWPFFGIIFSTMIAYIVFFNTRKKVNSLTR